MMDMDLRSEPWEPATLSVEDLMSLGFEPEPEPYEPEYQNPNHESPVKRRWNLGGTLFFVIILVIIGFSWAAWGGTCKTQCWERTNECRTYCW